MLKKLRQNENSSRLFSETTKITKILPHQSTVCIPLKPLIIRYERNEIRTTPKKNDLDVVDEKTRWFTIHSSLSLVVTMRFETVRMYQSLKLRSHPNIPEALYQIDLFHPGHNGACIWTNTRQKRLKLIK